MEQPKKELIKGIADLFQDYEETYVPGEWESFLKDKKGKRNVFPLMLRIAAILFLIVSVVPFNLKDLMPKGTKNEIVLQKPAPQKKGMITTDKNNVVSSSVFIAGKRIKSVSGISAAVNSSPINITALSANTSNTITIDTTLVLKHQLTSSGLQLAQAETEKATMRTKSKQDTTVRVKNKKMSTIDFLMAESKSGNTVVKKKAEGQKWDFGVEVIPTATTASMNVGAGLTTAYRISNKFSISSGIAITQLEGGKSVSGSMGSSSVNNNQVSFASNLSTKQVVGVNANIKAIDIPLGLVYHVNKHYYTSAGISYFNVISEKRDNTVVQVSQVNQSSVDPQTGMTATYRTLISQEVAEPTLDKPLKGNSYLGFFNFSVGRKQNIFGKYNVLIEPFIKVPLGELSNEDLKLMNSGIKFQLSF